MRSLVATVVFLLLSSVALAGNVHLKPPNRNPTFTDGGLTLAAAGALAGLGNGDLVIALTAQANVVSTCTNQGGNAAPGQNPAPITVTGSQAIPADAIKNGNVNFNVGTSPPATPIAGAPDCPNTNWTESIDDLLFTSAVITVQQPPPNTVLTVACTFSQPTSNGTVPRQNVSCSVS